MMLLTTEQVAEWAQVQHATIRREIRCGRLRAAKIGNGYRVTPDDRDAWWRSRLVIPDAGFTAVESARDTEADETEFGKLSRQMGRPGWREAIQDVPAEAGR